MRSSLLLLLLLGAAAGAACSPSEDNAYFHVVASSPREQVAVAVRGRSNLPSGTSALLPQTIVGPSEAFPLVTEVASAPPMAAVRDWLRQTLPCHGAVLFRGLRLTTAADFAEFVDGLDWPKVFIGGGGTARSTVADGVRTASDEPADHTIEPHQDMAHNPSYPAKLAFFMLENDAGVPGGETVLTDMRQVTERLHDVADAFARRGGVLYKKVLWDARRKRDTTFTWQRRLFAQTRADAEAELRRSSAGDNLRWDDDDGTLTYEHRLPATRTHPDTGETVFFNGIHTNHRDYFDLAPHVNTTSLGDSPYDTFFGDGTAIDPGLLDYVRGVWWNSSVALNVQPGDLVIVDNLLAGHGRFAWDPLAKDRTMLIAHLDALGGAAASSSEE